MSRSLTALPAASLLALALLAGCDDTPSSRTARDCAVPDGTQPFVFESGGRELFGFIDAPPGPGPHPAILLVHDAGRTDVTQGIGDFAALRQILRDAGFASVVWDRAGSGCSGGNYRGIADLFVRSDDVLAAADALGSSTEANVGPIGAWALGEGAWVTTIAASRSDALGFLILVGGPARDPIARIRYVAERNLEREGYSPDQANEVADQLVAALEMMRDQSPWRQYRAAVDALDEHPLLPPLSEIGADVFATESHYDELRESAVLHVTNEAFLPAIDVPVLALWGDQDVEVDWRESARLYREAFEKAANDAVTLRVIEGADHRLCAADTGGADGENDADGGCRKADEYVDTLTSWLRARFPNGGRQSRVDR